MSTPLLHNIRARRGATWLDRHWPGWHEQLDLETLDINSSRDCVGAQLAGSYNAFGRAVADDIAIDQVIFYGEDAVETRACSEWMIEHGFCSANCCGYKQLDIAWRAEIGRRLLLNPTNQEITT